MTWYKDDEPIKPKKGDKRIKIDWDMKQDLNILVIEKALAEDAGKYTAIAENKFGSFKFSVTVLVGKPEGAEIIKTIESKRSVKMIEETVVDGEVVDRKVTEEFSEEKPETVEVVKQEETTAVTISGTAEEVKESVMELKTVTVEAPTEEEGEPPKFVRAPEPVFVDFGETIELTCRVTGWKAYLFVCSK